MYKRKVYQEMLAWKQTLSRKRTALVIKGARQIGKTFIVNKFAHDNYENIIYINFFKNKKIKKCFEGDLDVDEIISSISANMPNVNFIPFKTVLIFDEVQDCANARSSIKPFCEDGRFDIIATGSSLGISGYSKKVDASIPVGSEYFINMKPMDFEEFLWAYGFQEKDIDTLRKFFLELKPLPEAMLDSYNKLFKYYICVGGMPEAIKTFLDTRDFNQVRITQKSILTSYEADFGKHLNSQEKVYINDSELQKIREVFYAIPYQLTQAINKFQFNKVKEGKKYKDYESSIRWLCDAELIAICHNVRNIQYPLEGYAIDNAFKIYMQDSGLLMSMFDMDIYDAIISGDMQTYKGYIYENMIADAFAKNSIPLFYYNNKYEIDFLTQFNFKICPIEVKAKDGNSKSLKTLMNHTTYGKEIIFAIKIKQGNIGFNNNVLTIPHFLSFLVCPSFIKNVIIKNKLNEIN